MTESKPDQLATDELKAGLQAPGFAELLFNCERRSEELAAPADPVVVQFLDDVRQQQRFELQAIQDAKSNFSHRRLSKLLDAVLCFDSRGQKLTRYDNGLGKIVEYDTEQQIQLDKSDRSAKRIDSQLAQRDLKNAHWAGIFESLTKTPRSNSATCNPEFGQICQRFCQDLPLSVFESRFETLPLATELASSIRFDFAALKLPNPAVITLFARSVTGGGRFKLAEFGDNGEIVLQAAMDLKLEFDRAGRIIAFTIELPALNTDSIIEWHCLTSEDFQPESSYSKTRLKIRLSTECVSLKSALERFKITDQDSDAHSQTANEDLYFALPGEASHCFVQLQHGGECPEKQATGFAVKYGSRWFDCSNWLRQLTAAARRPAQTRTTTLCLSLSELEAELGQSLPVAERESSLVSRFHGQRAVWLRWQAASDPNLTVQTQLQQICAICAEDLVDENEVQHSANLPAESLDLFHRREQGNLSFADALRQADIASQLNLSRVSIVNKLRGILAKAVWTGQDIAEIEALFVQRFSDLATVKIERSYETFGSIGPKTEVTLVPRQMLCATELLKIQSQCLELFPLLKLPAVQQVELFPVLANAEVGSTVVSVWRKFLDSMGRVEFTFQDFLCQSPKFSDCIRPLFSHLWDTRLTKKHWPVVILDN